MPTPAPSDPPERARADPPDVGAGGPRAGPAGASRVRIRARARTLVAPIADALKRTTALLRSHGPVSVESGLGWTAAALGLAILSVLSVLAFHAPEHLTTPMLRARYDVGLLRVVLFVAMLASATIAIAQLVAARQRGPNAVALALVALAAALGGAWVPVDDFPEGAPYVGLDWFVLDLLVSTAVFVAIERRWPLRPEQPTFREAWQDDLVYFAVNHALVGLLFLVVNGIVERGFGGLAHEGLQARVRALPFGLQLLACLFVADLIQYAVHRAFHEVPWLWRFHAIHHSARTIDWLAGSRLHVAEVVATRAAVLGPLTVLGFSREALDAFVVVVGVQAVLIHANVRLRLGPLRHLWATPQWHHWHHASDREALDRNYAVNFPVIDHLFGTAIRGLGDRMPRAYGLHGETVPDGFVAQLAWPLRRRARDR